LWRLGAPAGGIAEAATVPSGKDGAPRRTLPVATPPVFALELAARDGENVIASCLSLDGELTSALNFSLVRPPNAQDGLKISHTHMHCYLMLSPFFLFQGSLLAYSTLSGTRVFRVLQDVDGGRYVVERVRGLSGSLGVAHAAAFAGDTALLVLATTDNALQVTITLRFNLFAPHRFCITSTLNLFHCCVRVLALCACSTSQHHFGTLTLAGCSFFLLQGCRPCTTRGSCNGCGGLRGRWGVGSVPALRVT
jgi:hypothetical protein